MGDYESTWFCWEVCFGSRTGARQIPPHAHRNKTLPFVSALVSSSCFSMSGVACFAWALGTDMWRRILWKPATHHEPAHGPYYPLSRYCPFPKTPWTVQIRFTSCPHEPFCCHYDLAPFLNTTDLKALLEDTDSMARGTALAAEMVNADPLKNFQWVCVPHLCRKSWRCQTCHDRQQAQSQHMLVSRHNSGFWTVCATKALDSLDKSEVSWKTVQLCAFLNCWRADNLAKDGGCAEFDYDLAPFLNTTDLKALLEDTDSMARGAALAAEMGNTDPLENFQWVCIPHLCRKSWRCQTCHDRQQAQSQHMLVSRHNSGFWTVCATKALDSLDKSEVSWKTVQLCAFLNCWRADNLAKGWGVCWVWLWPGTFSKHHRPQGAARGYWFHGKGRGPRGRDGERRPTRKFPVGLRPPSLP